MVLLLKNIWAMPCFFQQCGIMTWMDSDKPVQTPFNIRNSKWCLVSSLIFRLAKALIRMHICAGLSELLLGAHITLLEILCCGSNLLLIIQCHHKYKMYNVICDVIIAKILLFKMYMKNENSNFCHIFGNYFVKRENVHFIHCFTIHKI